MILGGRLFAQDGSSISGGEPDPTSPVAIRDVVDATTAPPEGMFKTPQVSLPGEVLRDVSVAGADIR